MDTLPYAKERHLASLAVQRAALLTKQLLAEVDKGSFDKKDQTPVTIADFAAQASIIAAIHHTFPTDQIVGEEDSTALRENPTLLERTWELATSVHLDDPASEALLHTPSSRDELLELIDLGAKGACGPGRVPLFFLVLAACLFLVALFAIKIPRTASQTTAEADSPDQIVRRTKMPMPMLPLFIFSLAMLLYVGIENSLGGWLPSYGLRTTTLLASSVALYFWIAELSGRLLLAVLTSLFGEAALYRVSVLVLILTTAVLIAATHLGSGGVVALTILSGLALAPIYPLIVSFFLARTGNHPGLGPVFAVASLGGATLPWLTGAISTHFHALRDGLAVPAVGAILLLLLAPEITRRAKQRA